MVRFLTAFVAFCSLTLFCTAQAGGNISDTAWHDGWAFYSVTTQPGGVLHFEGGTPHEGGYQFNLVKDSEAGKYVIRAAYDDFDYIPLICGSQQGNIVSEKNVDGTRALVVTDSTGKVTDILLPLNDDLHSLMVKHLLMQLDGIYRADNGTTFTFSGTKVTVQPANAKLPSGEFCFEDSYDFPANVITITNGTMKGNHYNWEFSEQGMTLSWVKAANPDEEADIAEVELVNIKTWELKKVGNINYTGDGNWPITSKQLLPGGYFSNYNAPTLRLMRNEVFARHGYIFNDPMLKEYFSKQSWYKPQFKNIADVNLSETERINVQLMRNFEDQLNAAE